MTRGSGNVLGLAAFLGITLGGTGVSMLLAGPGPTLWYQSLQEPAFTPPPWIFPIVWTGIYVLMSVAAWAVWRQRPAAGVKRALVAYFVQLFFNALWAPVFFGLHNLPLATADVVVLLLAIVLTARLFFDVSSLAGWLMLPYLCWTGFAMLLTMSLWRLNG